MIFTARGDHGFAQMRNRADDLSKEKLISASLPPFAMRFESKETKLLGALSPCMTSVHRQSPAEQMLRTHAAFGNGTCLPCRNATAAISDVCRRSKVSPMGPLYQCDVLTSPIEIKRHR